MRLFTAIELDTIVRDDVAELAATVQRRVGERAPRARITWVAPDRMHLTLRFIGEVDDGTGERIISALRAPLPLAPFDITFDALGAFPPKGPPRVLWVGIDRGRDALMQAESMIGERLLSLGIAREERAYRPHLTLARIREPAGVKAAPLFEGLSPTRRPTRVDAITLFQSRLSPKGPTYTVLERTPLRDGY